MTSTDAKNADAAWPVVAGFPISHEKKYVTEYDIELNPPQGGVKVRCWILVRNFQPLAKAKVMDDIGQLMANVVEEAFASFFDYNSSLP